ncbi:hypothetical protein [Methylibium sp.]|uniref:hypothetical protein n=1 Tax=Methylibium sp. TaxID=2067992 RepID=UPI003D0C6E64
MATPNYSYEKRQRELAKKRKKEEKLQRKTTPGKAGEEGSEPNPNDAATGAPPAGTPPEGGSA